GGIQVLKVGKGAGLAGGQGGVPITLGTAATRLEGRQRIRSGRRSWLRARRAATQRHRVPCWWRRFLLAVAQAVGAPLPEAVEALGVDDDPARNPAPRALRIGNR